MVNLNVFPMFRLLCFTWLAVSSMELDRPYYDIEQSESLFEEFIVNYGRTYSNQREKQVRLEIFKNNLLIINEKNKNNGATFGINRFADMTDEEIRSQYMCLRRPSGLDVTKNGCKTITDADVTTHDAPESVNWITKGAVTGVKDQQRCGSCWAFATVGNIEGQYFLKHNKLVSLSEQELVDCSKSNSGCRGGIMDMALIDLINLGGLQSEASYPYQAMDQQCRFDKSKVVAKLSGCTSYNLKDEDKLKEVLAKNGPIVLGVNGEDLSRYTGGIMTVQNCRPEPLSHAVLLVGYGTDQKLGMDYWLVKNSWSDSWGERGYFRLKRGDNVCGLMTEDNCSAVLA